MAIANSRLLNYDGQQVSFKYKDYRRSGQDRYGRMTLGGHEFIRRFLIHVLPSGFHRIRHYGLFANGGRKKNLETIRRLLAVVSENAGQHKDDNSAQGTDTEEILTGYLCPLCGGPMSIIETFKAGHQPISGQARAPPGQDSRRQKQAA